MVPENEPFTWTVFQGILLTITLMTNLTSLAYVKWTLKLNESLLNVLKLHLGIIVFCITISISGYIFAYMVSFRSLYTCSLNQLPIAASMISSYAFPTAVSVIR